MRHIIYLHADYDFSDMTFTDLEREAGRDPKAFLERAKKDPEMTVYHKISDFAFDFNDEKISDEGFLIIIDDNKSPKDVDLEKILMVVRQRGVPAPDNKKAKILYIAPRDFYTMEDDPFELVNETLGYDPIDMPVMDKDGYYCSAYFLAIEAMPNDTLRFMLKNDTDTFWVEQFGVYAEYVEMLREVVCETLGEEQYAWLKKYNYSPLQMDLCKAERWFRQSNFITMERISGYKQFDFSDEDGSQDFVDAVENWWNTLSKKDKIETWKENK